jgi:RIO kinase 1
LSNTWDPRTALDPFFEQGKITDILRVVKSGKEATVYCCRAHPAVGIDLVAAKIYRPREHRGFKDDSIYRQGRHMTDSRLRRAVANKSRKGREVAFGSWVGHEAGTLADLGAAGVHVPRLIASAPEGVLMEYIGDIDGPAPRLAEVDLNPDDARGLFQELLRDLERMLLAGHIHGDLSPYNLLYWQGRITIIDVPQTVNPLTNPNAFDLLIRDARNVCDYFRCQGVTTGDPDRIAQRLWRAGRLPGR